MRLRAEWGIRPESDVQLEVVLFKVGSRSRASQLAGRVGQLVRRKGDLTCILIPAFETLGKALQTISPISTTLPSSTQTPALLTTNPSPLIDSSTNRASLPTATLYALSSLNLGSSRVRSIEPADWGSEGE